MKIFDQFGKDIGYLDTGGISILPLIFILFVGEIWLVYKFFQMPIKGAKLLSQGNFSDGMLYFIPHMIIIFSSITLLVLNAFLHFLF